MTASDNPRAGNSLRKKLVHKLSGTDVLKSACGRYVRETGSTTMRPSAWAYYTLLPHTEDWLKVTCSQCLVKGGRPIPRRLGSITSQMAKTRERVQRYLQENPNTKLTIKSHTIEKLTLRAIADTLEGLGVGEVLSVMTVEPVDRDAVQEAFKQLIRELRQRGKK